MSALTIIGRTLSPKGVIKAVYLAEHGYAPYTGALLYHYYNTPERAKKLVDAGHWQCLNKYLPEDIGVNENQKSLLNSARSSIIFSDRYDMQAHKNGDIESVFFYMWDNDHWEVSSILFESVWTPLNEIFSEVHDFKPQKDAVDLSPAEWIEMFHQSKLPKEPHPIFWRISHSQLSISRYYGGCTYNKHYYVYFQSLDALFREDFLKEVKCKIKQRKNNG